MDWLQNPDQSMLRIIQEMATDQEMDYGQRAELRKRLAYPIMRAFEKWIEGYYPKALPGGRMSKALAYTYNLFMRLSRYHLDGRYLPDSNLAYPNIWITWLKMPLDPWLLEEKGICFVATMKQLKMLPSCILCWDVAKPVMLIPGNG